MSFSYAREYDMYLSRYHAVNKHIKEKLKNMPNNKGFICNGIWLYGHQKCTSSKITVMFEKAYPYLYIHEITKKTHKLIRMDMNTREKTVVSVTTRLGGAAK